MTQNTTQRPKLGFLLVLLGLVLLVAVFGFALATSASAAMYEGNVTADQPDNQTVEVDVDFSADTTVDAELVRDGSTVVETTIDGADGVETGELDLTGLGTGEFELVVSDDADATLAETRMVTYQEAAVNATQNETILVDVEFAADELTEAHVQFEQGTETNATTLEFDPVEAEDGQGIETAEWDAETDGYVDVTVETEPATSYEAMWVSIDSGFFGGSGIVAGASRNQILGFLAVVLGLVAAYNRDII